MDSHNCIYTFHKSGRPRAQCNLPRYKGDYCIFHSRSEFSDEFLNLLFDEITKPDHWLEGIYFNHDLKNVNLSNINMPSATFEGLSLNSVSLDSANLEGAVFRNTRLEGVSFYSTYLKDAIFDEAKFINSENQVTDFRESELGGASFTGVNFYNVRLQNLKLSKPTRISCFLTNPSFEFINGQWDSAAYIYSTLGERARKDWDNQSEDSAIYLAMTCRHRRIISAAPICERVSINNWFMPSIKGGLKGIGWLAHRISWGYGYKPFRLITVLIAIIILFAACFTMTSCITEDTFFHLALKSLLLSTQSLFTISYGTTLPFNKFSEVLGTIEAFIGTILISLFVVSLTLKFMRRV